MKKQLITLTLLLVGAVANAQISKGDLELGGSFNFHSQETTNGDVDIFKFLPRAGLFLGDNMSLGLALGYSSITVPTFDVGAGVLGEGKTTDFSYGVYTRFYKNVADNLYLFLQPFFQLSSGEIDQPGANPDGDTDGYTLALTGGISYFINQKFALELTSGNLSYTHANVTTSGGEVKNNRFDASLNLSHVNVGLTFFLKKK